MHTDEDEFWSQARASMDTDEARAELRHESERLAGSLRDELEPEPWDDESD